MDLEKNHWTKHQIYFTSIVYVSEVAQSMSVSVTMKSATDVVSSLMNTSLKSTDLSESE